LLRTVKRWCSPSERAEHAAAKEEQRISDELTGLPAGWFVVHSHDIGDRSDVVGDADHVVIGPGGVFLIHLEHQPGANVWVSEHTVTINGRDSDHLCAARIEAREVGDRLTDACGFDVAVQSALVLIGAATVQTLSRPAEVHVRTQYDVRDWLCKQPTRLDAEMVSAIHKRLRPSAPAYAFGSSTTTGI
jgi:Nuclease-related domain